MKLLIAFLLLSKCAIGCEICGCSVANMGLGILPNFQNNFIGLRYQHYRFNTVHPDDNNSVSQEYFNNLELWGRFVPIQNVQIFGSVPYRVNTQIESDMTNQVSDLGDVALTVNYILFNKSIDSQSKWRHIAQSGCGLKLPTGKSDIVQNQHTLLPNMQPGTGSIDYTFNMLYIIRFKDVGLNLDANYRLNTENGVQYQKGNQYLLSSKLFLLKSLKDGYVIIPHAGMDYEISNADFSYQKRVDYSGSNVLMGNLGIDFYKKNFSLGVNLQVPVLHSLNEGNTTNPYRASTQLIYFFNTNKNNKICQI